MGERLLTAHVGRVAVEQVVGHAQQRLLQLVPEAGDRGELAGGGGGGRGHRRALVVNPVLRGGGLQAEVLVQPLHLPQGGVFGFW